MSGTPPLLVVAFDFDGTLAEGTWPSPTIGAPIAEGLNLLRKYADDGYEVIIHTARPKAHEAMIWGWLDALKLGTVVYDVICGKPRADIYIDDKAQRFERA